MMKDRDRQKGDEERERERDRETETVRYSTRDDSLHAPVADKQRVK